MNSRDGELRIKCRGTIAAEFWKRDVENVYNTDRDKFVKVLEVKESQWPGKFNFVDYFFNFFFPLSIQL